MNLLRGDIESSLRESRSDSWQSTTNQSRVSATESRPIRGAKNRIQGRSSASADFLLESELRGSPPKSEKRQLLGTQFKYLGGAEATGAALLRKETHESKHNKIISDSRIAKMDSSLRATRYAQNNKSSVDCFGNESPCNDGTIAFESFHNAPNSSQRLKFCFLNS